MTPEAAHDNRDADGCLFYIRVSGYIANIKK